MAAEKVRTAKRYETSPACGLRRGERLRLMRYLYARMTSPLPAIEALHASLGLGPVRDIEKIPQSGSDRAYFRVYNADGTTLIATVSPNHRENETFLYFSEQLGGAGAPVPRILAVAADRSVYLQEDLGDTSLLQVLEQEGYTPRVEALFRKSLEALAELQVRGDRGLDYTRCITSRAFGQQAILSDLLYFKYYFLDPLGLAYDKERILGDMETLASQLSRSRHTYFMFRDFQSRNILVKDEAVHFIDFQGGMKGAIAYDAASLLWQAKAALPPEWKERLMTHYMDALDQQLPAPLDRAAFLEEYNGYVLIRLLQVLGAYGFRGLFERKAHFLTSIPLGLRNLRWFLDHQSIGLNIPAFRDLLNQVAADAQIARFEPLRAKADTPLTVTIRSFSYLKNGYPEDTCENGGGFVFDCRGILNPGRTDAYKPLSGQDKPVKDFLEQQTDMPRFLNSVYDLVDITVQDYLRRDFAHLQVSFGCTGGQHRSVYAAEALQRHLRNKFGVRTTVAHLNQSNWVSA